MIKFNGDFRVEKIIGNQKMWGMGNLDQVDKDQDSIGRMVDMKGSFMIGKIEKGDSMYKIIGQNISLIRKGIVQYNMKERS